MLANARCPWQFQGNNCEWRLLNTSYLLESYVLFRLDKDY